MKQHPHSLLELCHSSVHSSVQDCNMVHSGQPYGENLLAEGNGEIQGSDTVNFWPTDREAQL